MSLIPSDFINELITRADIVEIINHRISLKKMGRNYSACCPFHDEKTPSFSVNPSKQFYYCFGCGAGGNVISFLMAYERLEFIEAVEALAKSLGLEVPHASSGKHSSVQHKTQLESLYGLLERKTRYYQEQLNHSAAARQYLASRGLSPETISRYFIGYCPDIADRENQQDIFRGRIIFPIHDRRGRVIAFGGRVLKEGRMPKYLNSKDSAVFHKSHVLYGLYQTREKYRDIEKLLIVEGYMDVVSLAERGIDFAVATLGTATTPEHVKLLLQQTSSLIFCFDGDNAGRKAAWRAVSSAFTVMRDDADIRFLFLPENEDPDSLVKKEGKENFLKRFNDSQSLADFFFGTLKSQVINVASVEGRSKFSALATPYLETLPEGVFREMMLEKLSELVRLDKRKLSGSAQKKHSLETPARFLKIQRTPMRLAIGLCLQYPQLISEIPSNMIEKISHWTFKGSELLKQIILLLKTHPNYNTANILEHFRDKPGNTIDLLFKLSAWEHGVPEEGVASEWKDILKAFEKKQREMAIEKLMAKSHLNLLSQEEKSMLQQLLSEKSEKSDKS